MVWKRRHPAIPVAEMTNAIVVDLIEMAGVSPDDLLQNPRYTDDDKRELRLTINN
jgi:hypothetical protein